MRRAHAAEVREIHELYRQRAPYETAVGRTRLGELKRQLRLQVGGEGHAGGCLVEGLEGLCAADSIGKVETVVRKAGAPAEEP